MTLPFVMVPKVSRAQDIETLSKDLPQDLGTLFPIIESAKGLINCDEIFQHSRVSLALFGGVDYASDLDCDMSWDTLLYARSKLAASVYMRAVNLQRVRPHMKYFYLTPPILMFEI